MVQPAWGQTCWIAHWQSVGVFCDWPSSSSFFLATQNADVQDVRTDEVWKPQWQLWRLFSLRSSSRRPEVPCSVPARHGSFVQLLPSVREPQFSEDAGSPATCVRSVDVWATVFELNMFDYLILFWNLLQVGWGRWVAGGGKWTEAEYQQFNPPSGRAPCPTSCCTLKRLFWQKCRMFTRNVSSATGQNFISICWIYINKW